LPRRPHRHGALRQQTERIGYPILGVVTQINQMCRDKLGEYVHWGATTQDITDTATVLQIREALDLVEADLDGVARALARLAREHRLTPVIGRSNLQQAIPVTFGYKMAGLLSAVLRHRERLAQLRQRVLVGEFAGAAGTLASLETGAMETQAGLCAELGLGQPMIAWHTIRDNIAEVGTVLGLIGGTLGKLSMDVKLMMQTEVGEVYEPYHHGRGSSSTMPQKRNPISQLLHPRARAGSRLTTSALRPPLARHADGLRPGRLGRQAGHRHRQHLERHQPLPFALQAAGGRRQARRAAGRRLPLELPAIALAENFVKPTTMLYRNLLAMETEELLRSHPVDGAVLMGGCDKTTPGLVMGALSHGPALRLPARRPDAARQLEGPGAGLGLGRLEVLGRTPRRQHLGRPQWLEIEGGIARSHGTCMTMGTAATMMGIAEALGLTLPGASRASPRWTPTTSAWPRECGRRIVDMVWEDLTPARMLTRAELRQRHRRAMAMGCSTNAIIHLVAMSRRAGLPVTLDDFDAASRKCR
jgi:hypothetical protein